MSKVSFESTVALGGGEVFCCLCMDIVCVRRLLECDARRIATPVGPSKHGTNDITAVWGIDKQTQLLVNFKSDYISNDCLPKLLRLSPQFTTLLV